MKKYLLAFAYGCCSAISACAQYTEIFTDDIKTLQVAVDGEFSRLPIISWGKGEQLNVSFDDLTHDYRRYIYRIEHCSYDFKISEQLFESEYLSSPTNEEIITDYAQSLNTTVLYTHYSFSLPNANMRPLLSGNYRLSIWRDGEDGNLEKVAQTYFAIVEPRATIHASISSNTEIDYQAQHQQVSMEIDLSNQPGVDNPQEEIKTYVLQNRRWDNAVINPPYTSQFGNRLLWQHARSLIFPATNEYRKMEMLSTRYTTMRMERLYSLNGIYHAEIVPDKPRTHYIYDEDQNGRCVVRSDDRTNDATESDYFLTHFSFVSPPFTGRRLFLNGRWTDGRLSPRYELKYNAERGCYEADILLKQGYYSYQYLTTDRSRSQGRTDETEGNFFQTENEYTILVYFRNQTERYDRLIGVQQLHSPIQ